MWMWVVFSQGFRVSNLEGFKQQSNPTLPMITFDGELGGVQVSCYLKS